MITNNKEIDLVFMEVDDCIYYHGNEKGCGVIEIMRAVSSCLQVVPTKRRVVVTRQVGLFKTIR